MITEGHEQIILTNRPPYQSIIAIHSTQRGPAMGGTRFREYESVDDAQRDALQLSRAMTDKATFADLPFGGGKAVIVKRPSDRRAIFDEHARVLNELNGRFVTAEDVGTTPEDMDQMSQKTDHVLGTTQGSGDPGPMTAFGVRRCMRIGLKHRAGLSLDEARVALQGLGSVGWELGQQLHDAGADLIVTDTDRAACERARHEWGASVCEPEAIYDADADVFAPCAIGGVLNDDTVERLSVCLVAGSANNPLHNETVVKKLHERSILYLPDFAINTGGLISVTRRRLNLDTSGVRERIIDLSNRVEKLIQDAQRTGRAPYRVARTWIDEALNEDE